MAGNGKRREIRGLDEVPDKIGGQAFAVRETPRDARVIERVGEPRLDHDERGGREAEGHEREREQDERPRAAHRLAPIRSVRCVRR